MSDRDYVGPESEIPDEPPPFLGTWNRVYVGVLIYLVVIIGLFYAFTRAFNR